MTPERLGQHFLRDAGWREKIARAIFSGTGPTPTAGGTWIEIGAGHGEMTAWLARRAGRVLAIELDPKLLPQLRQMAAQIGNLTVITGDVMSLDLDGLVGHEGFYVYGNLPYYITSPIVHRLFDYGGRIEAAFLVMQLEVAMRLTAKPGSRDYGYLSVMTQYYFRPEILLPIPPVAFHPPPKVTSALVALRLPSRQGRVSVADETGFRKFLKACFAQKRKMLRNNLRALLASRQAEEILDELRISRNARAEELTLEELAGLFAACQASPGRRGKD